MGTTVERSRNKVGFGRIMLWQSRPVSLTANLLYGMLSWKLFMTNTRK